MNYPLLRLFCLLFIGLAPASIYASDNPRVIRIQEIISKQTLNRLALELRHFKNTDRFPAGLIVLLDSAGGDGQAGMQIGRLLRQNNAHVFAMRQCDSACAFILMGGVVRAAAPGSIGIHAGRLTMMTPEGAIVKEVDASKSLDNSYQLVGFNNEVRLYLKEMGIRHGLLDLMLAQPASGLYKPTPSEMNLYEITAINSSYPTERINSFAHDPVLASIDRKTLVKRTRNVPQRCASSSMIDEAFVNCYRHTLLGPGRP